jgi:L-iditol 2-dehydrogenase
MQALLRPSREPGLLMLVDRPLPAPARHEVLAQVAYAGICGSDLEILHDRVTLYRPPVVQGHELSAIVVAVGSNVHGLAPDDAVVSETIGAVCGRCQPCRLGAHHLCEAKEPIGWTRDGGFAEYVVLHSAFVHRVPPGVALDAAALAEPSAVAAETVLVRGGLRAGERVAVVGPGPIGLLCARMALIGGAREVYLLGRPDDEAARFPIARALGVTHCLSAKEGPTAVRELAGGDLPDLVVEASGTPGGFVTALGLTRRGGRIAAVGSLSGAIPASFPQLAACAIDLQFIFASSRRAWELVMAALADGSLDPRPLISRSFPLKEYKAAFAAAANSATGVKVLLRPTSATL